MSIKLQRFIAALSTAIIASVAWPSNGSLTPLIFGAFVPMLWLEYSIRTSKEKKKGRKVFLYSWLAFGGFNLGTTWWVGFASPIGVVATVFINGALMAFCFWLYHQVAKSIGSPRALLVMPFLWMLVEYLHMDWDMSFPWLNLGYALANRVTWIQWYSYLGTWGGTLWILWVNAMIFYGWISYEKKERIKAWAWYVGPLLFIPLIVSHWMYANYEDKGEAMNVVVVQPNIDAYKKFEISNDETADRFLRLASPFLSDSTDYLIGPETMLGMYDERGLAFNRPVARIMRIADTLPRLHTVIGATTSAFYGDEKKTSTARLTNRGQYYDVFNSSLHFTNSHEEIEVYHKTKLVVGVEMVPFVSLLGSVAQGIDLGGATGTLGGQEDREVFGNRNNEELKVASVICWEMDFPGFTSDFVENGANVIFAITNDGWWRDTPGKDQHLHYARVRAIENRRSVARSANTGISCVINQRGDVMEQIPYEQEGAFAATILANDEITLFTEMGDFIGRISLFISIIVLLSIFVKRFVRK